MKNRLRSFKFAIKGVVALFAEEANAKIHLTCAIIVIFLGWYFELKLSEWLWITLAIGIVFITEAINTAIENLCDLISIEKDKRIARIKDLAAGSVLIASITSAIIGLVIFLPKVM